MNHCKQNRRASKAADMRRRAYDDAGRALAQKSENAGLFREPALRYRRRTGHEQMSVV